uniref:Unk like zinc finger n=1 Tax=Otolemur garnettii TaxID=30611 RepID=H0XWW0_OTOGA
QTEKPTHYRYLKEFRTEQCSLFLQHKCTQHRPFTCFHWHFLNQRRRRPLRRRDGTFNYSPDVYCSKYDEATGVCPDGDECPCLHRTAGDTERKYHLRYYKTGTCIHETDARGHCVKNGLHCAFAHGPLDLRPPVCDIRELQAQEALQNGQLGGGDGVPDLQPGVLASQAMIEKLLGEDPRWQDANFVLGSYKTEQCPKPPRLCRQGYACPHFHSSRDRRRNPRRFQYRSTPCPSVKHGDEWGEPSRCDGGDSCQYCHSRTEQQFHPEVCPCLMGPNFYFSGKCRYSCLHFKHLGDETISLVLAGSEQVSCTALPLHTHMAVTEGHSQVLSAQWDSETPVVGSLSCRLIKLDCPMGTCVSPGGGFESPARTRQTTMTAATDVALGSVIVLPQGERQGWSGIEPLCHMLKTAKPKPPSTSSEGKKSQPVKQQQLNHLAVFAVVHPLAPSVSSSVASSTGSGSSSPTALPALSARTLPLGPASSTVEAVLGSALDIRLGDVNVTSLEKDLEEHNGHDLGPTDLGPRSLAGSAPVAIPGSLPRSPSLHSSSSLSTSPLSSLSQSLPGPLVSTAMTPPQQPLPLRSEPGVLGSSASSYSSLGLNGVPGSIWDFVSGSFSPSPSPVLSTGPTSLSASPNGAELARVRRQLDEAKRKIRQWEESWRQVKQACDAWQREAQEAKERARVADSDRQLALQKKEEVEAQVRQLQEELEGLGLSALPGLRSFGEIGALPLPELHSLQSQLRLDLEAVDGVIFHLHTKQCVACREQPRGAILQPCQHHVLCEPRVASAPECPYCEGQPLQCAYALQS